jgi:hypothetical protein
MLSFEKIVQESARTLAVEHPEITAEIVRDVLIDAGIDDVLRETAPTPQGRLLIHAIAISGNKQTGNGEARPFNYERKLGPGLWAWVGHNGSGKSTIFGCLLWALTGSDSRIPKRIRPWIGEIRVQFSVGDEAFTSRIKRDEDRISGGIYFGQLDADHFEIGILNPAVVFDGREDLRDSIDRFFLQRLGISTLRWTAHSPEKDDPELHAHSTTWRTYANAMHIDDDSYDYLIIDPQKGYGRQDRKILEMMLGVEQSRIVSEIQVQADFAKEAYGRARVKMVGKRSNIGEQIASLEREAGEVEAALALLQGTQTVTQVEDATADKRERRARLLTEQNAISQQLSDIDAQTITLERDILEAEREKIALIEQGEAEYLVNSLVVTRCPHCENPVQVEDRISAEREGHVCHVCTQPMQRTRTQADIKAILRERDAALNTLRAMLKRRAEDAAALKAQLAGLRTESALIARELETSVQQARDGFSTSYASMLIQKGQIDGQLAQLRQAQVEIDTEQHEVEAAARWQLILQTAADIADTVVFETNEAIFTQIGSLAATLAGQFGVPDLEEVTIDEKRFVRLCQGGVQVGHTDLARSERVKFKVAFHLALMILQVRYGMGRHPGFLIIDTPGTAEVNEVDFVAMAKDLASIHTVYGDRLQILLATARPEALAHMPPGVSATVSVGETFF